MEGVRSPEIIVIPEKYYGVALKLKAPDLETEKKPTPPPSKPVVVKPVIVQPNDLSHHSHWPMIAVVVGIILLIGGGFVYLNRDLLFKKEKPLPPVEVPVVVSPPAVPANLSAVLSGNAVTLNWIDTATNETGFRVERKELDGTFIPLTNLPVDSTAFLDNSILPEKTYTYHLVALGSGGESSPSNEPTVSTASSIVKTSPPVGGLDSDSDGLSDMEEPLYGTDPQNPDADKDGFLDGNEVFHLYNPAAKAPVRLLDSGLVKVFSGTAGWSLYIPIAWQTKLDSSDGARATIDSGQGDHFVLSIEENLEKKNVLDWYLEKHPGTLSSAVRSVTTKGGLEGILSVDRLEAMFPWGGKIFLLTYAPAGQFFQFRTTFEMLLNSLKLVGAPVIAMPSDQAIGGPGALLGVSPTSTQGGSTSSSEGVIPVTVGVVSSSSSNVSSSSATSTQP